MEELKAYWTKTKDAFWSLISKIESSVYFERLASKYDSLPPRQQKTLKSLSLILVASLTAWLFLSPLVNTRLKFSENRSFFSLISSMKIFNSQLASAKKEFLPPMGWQNMPSETFEQLQDSVVLMMASLGVPEEQYEVASQGETLLIHAREATIKQLESLMFQIDGLYPRYTVVRNKTSLHPTNKELIQFEIEIGKGDGRASSFSAPQFGDQPALEDEDDDFLIEEEIQKLPPHSAPSNLPNNGGLNLPPSEDFRPPAPPSNGGYQEQEPHTFSPLEGDPDGEYIPSNREGGDFSPPMGEDFIPPPPPDPEDEMFNDVPIPDNEFPPPPPIE